MRMKSILMATALIASAMATGARAQTPTLEVIVFAGGSAMPIYVAQDKGFFEKEGVKVNVTATPSSGFQMSNLVSGKFNIAGTAVDNLVAYQEGQGTAKLDRKPDLVAILGGSSVELALMAQPSIKSVDQLKGKTFAVDSLSTGFAFVLRAMLEKNGFKPDDYKLEAVGGTKQRLEALKADKVAAALMTEPFTTQAKRAGFTDLGDAVKSVGPYQSGVQIAMRDWVKNNEKAVVAYIRGFLAGVNWIYDPANQEEAAKILASRLKIPPAAAKPTIDRLVKGPMALARDGKIDVEGLKTVLALRERYAQPSKKLQAPEAYFDFSYYEKAIAR